MDITWGRAAAKPEPSTNFSKVHCKMTQRRSHEKLMMGSKNGTIYIVNH